MTVQRDPKTGRFCSKAQLIAAQNTEFMEQSTFSYQWTEDVAPVRFAKLWERRCGPICQLKKGHRGMHARRAGFGAHHW